jgi:chemosensory pili system protein ChpA (sensor histidine kinase/response regulator)
VDDEPHLRRLGALALVQSGYDVDTAADGAEGWDALQHAHYNLLITDNDVPRLTGLELAANARLAGMRLPILMTSSSPGLLHDPACARLGLAAFLAKPFASGTLIETVEQVLLATNSGTAISQFARIARSIEPFSHGGINE